MTGYISGTWGVDGGGGVEYGVSIQEACGIIVCEMNSGTSRS